MVAEQYPYEDKYGNKHPNLIKHYSDLNLKIQRVGTEEIYEVAVEPYPTTNMYIETDIPIEPDEPVKTEEQIEETEESEEV